MQSTETLLTTGYALAVFIPISFACIAPIESLRWALVAIATATSGLFILLNLRGPVFETAGVRCTEPECTMFTVCCDSDVHPLAHIIDFANVAASILLLEGLISWWACHAGTL